MHVGQRLQLLVPLLHPQHEVVHVGPEGANQGPKNLQGWIKVAGCGDLPRLRHQGGGALLFLLERSDNTSTWDSSLPPTAPGGLIYCLLFAAQTFKCFQLRGGKGRK